MKEDLENHKNKEHLRGDRFKGKEHPSHHRGPKTFRRGRALAFLEMMNVKRSTIKQQLDQPEFQSIHQVIVGELKAIDMVINEFTQLFEIQEGESLESFKKGKGYSSEKSKGEKLLESNQKGLDFNEEN
ncbi:hypothetical protein JOC75_001115 [Metabacillus crassostreae]|uniref:hypothetical protein n=1 Tax=Metabacillus crassostreae TaxID=929098 RepID=UPI001958259B|nr:hypothetical protein [Metabacillus crassostreae]MBM7603145.1 hypothetical protein [Metabacillus crassostreae]